MRSGFEQKIGGATSVIHLDFYTKSFENVQLTCENSTNIVS